MLSQEEVCPICSAGLAACGHELVRWSYVASELEPCALRQEVQPLENAVYTVLQGPRAPMAWPELSTLYSTHRFSPESIDGDDDLPDADVAGCVLAAIERMPGVVRTDEGTMEHPTTCVLWSADPQAVRECMCALVRELELFADSETDPEMTAPLTEELAAITFATAWNRLDPTEFIKLLAENCRYSSQHVFTDLSGKNEISNYLRGKMDTIRSRGEADPEVRVSVRLGISATFGNRPCACIAQGATDAIKAAVLFDVVDGKVTNCSMCIPELIGAVGVRTAGDPAAQLDPSA